MPRPLKVKLGGYAPEWTTHGRALRRIGAVLEERLGDRVEVTIEFNVLEAGRQVQQLVHDVDIGRITVCYFSTSYLVGRVPELAIIDLPYIFDSADHAHRNLDGKVGRFLAQRTRAATGLVTLGYWDNGIRHLSNRVREVRWPADCNGMRIRLQPNWAHEHFFRTLGAVPVCSDLREGIEMIKNGEVDAQENPLANMLAYGVDRVHPYVTLSGHAYGARAVFASAAELRGWPEEARRALRQAVSTAVAEQRIASHQGETNVRTTLEAAGTRIADLNAEELRAFRSAARPTLARAHQDLGEKIFGLLLG